MVAFFDTSALIKHYLQESGTETVKSVFKKVAAVSVSVITKSEMVSALNFKRRYANLSDPDYRRIMTEFEVNLGDFEVVPLDESTEAKIRLLAEKYAHKALDNIQLASALVAKPTYFVTADKKLARLAKSERLKVKLV